MTDLVIINKSALVMAADIAAWIAVANPHYAQEFGLAWGVSGTWYFGDAPTGAWPFTLQDGDVPAGDLAFHYDDATGIPYGTIDAQGAKNSGNDWRTALDHEGKETLVDPSCTLYGADEFTLRECCDPVEESLVMRGGMPFSNFILPAYLGLATGTKFDFNGELTAAAPATLPGGYVEQYVGGRYQITYGMKARTAPSFMASRVNGRRAWRALKAL